MKWFIYLIHHHMVNDIINSSCVVLSFRESVLWIGWVIFGWQTCYTIRITHTVGRVATPVVGGYNHSYTMFKAIYCCNLTPFITSRGPPCKNQPDSSMQAKVMCENPWVASPMMKAALPRCRCPRGYVGCQNRHEGFYFLFWHNSWSRSIEYTTY